MVKIIYWNIQPVSKLVCVPCIVTYFGYEAYTSGMNDNFKILNPLNAILNATTILTMPTNGLFGALSFSLLKLIGQPKRKK